MTQETQVWSIRDLMKFSIDHLQRHGFNEARLTVELLLASALQRQRIELYTHFDQPLSKEELKAFRALFERRLHHEPVQYITGSTSFMGLQFQVDARAFIPRPETETLVEQTMLICGQRQESHCVSILEIGTGSGNIAVSLAKLVRDVQVTTIDTNAAALELARANAAARGCADSIVFQELSLFDELAEILPHPYDMLVSNPPYVSEEEWSHLAPEICKFEPKEAVTDSKDGYVFYRRIARIARDLVRKDGWVVVEVGHGQAENVRTIFSEGGMGRIRIVADLQEIPRVVIGLRN
jgi:release factor glutamine methyltransferase